MPSEAFAGLIGVYKVSGCSGALRAPVLGCRTPERDILQPGRRCSKAVHSAPSPDGASPRILMEKLSMLYRGQPTGLGFWCPKRQQLREPRGASKSLRAQSNLPLIGIPAVYSAPPRSTLLPPFSLMIFLKLCRRWQLPSHPTWDRGNVLAPCTRVWKHSFHLCSRPALKGPNHTHFTLEPQRGKIFYFFQNKLLPIQIAI